MAVQVQSRFRLSLRTMLILLAVLPLLLAMRFTRELRFDRYKYVDSSQGPYFNESMWKKNVCDTQWQLEYLLIYLPLNKTGSGSPGGVATSDVLATPCSKGISRIPAGLFLDGRRVNKGDSIKCFVYDPEKKLVLPLPIDAKSIESLTPQKLDTHNFEEFWNREILPFLYQQQTGE